MPLKSKALTIVPVSRQKKIASLPIEVATLPIPSFEPILTGEQVARLLQVEPGTIYEFTRRRANGRNPIPFLRAGKFLRFRWSEVERWLVENRNVA
jgi:excisionase family DNA binding protein